MLASYTLSDVTTCCHGSIYRVGDIGHTVATWTSSFLSRPATTLPLTEELHSFAPARIDVVRERRRFSTSTLTRPLTPSDIAARTPKTLTFDSCSAPLVLRVNSQLTLKAASVAISLRIGTDAPSRFRSPRGSVAARCTVSKRQLSGQSSGSVHWKRRSLGHVGLHVERPRPCKRATVVASHCGNAGLRGPRGERSHA